MSTSEPILNRKLVLETPVPLADGAGGSRVIWSPLGALWGEVRASAGSETEQGDVTVSTVTYRITVRAAPLDRLSRPRPNQRFRDADRVFAIEAVLELGTDGRFLTCIARQAEIAP